MNQIVVELIASIPLASTGHHRVQYQYPKPQNKVMGLMGHPKKEAQTHKVGVAWWMADYRDKWGQGRLYTYCIHKTQKWSWYEAEQISGVLPSCPNIPLVGFVWGPTKDVWPCIKCLSSGSSMISFTWCTTLCMSFIKVFGVPALRSCRIVFHPKPNEHVILEVSSVTNVQSP